MQPHNPSQTPLPQAAEGYPSLLGKRVVIVEDEGMTQIVLGRILKHAGLLLVGAAPDGKTGVEVVLHQRPDLVLMDINMPVMDGLEACEHIFAAYHPCVVMLTAYHQESYRQRAEKLGTSGYLVKPINQVSLLPQLEAAFRRWLTLH